MSYPRPSARTSTGVLLALMLFSIAGTPVVLGKDSAYGVPTLADPTTTCSAGQMPTNSRDELHPPNTVRVLRSKGPHAGHVETVDFWNYVAVVMRAEYATGADKPPLWMRIGAITVKQYGWFKAAYWQGGRKSFTVDNGDGTTTTTTECYDLKDTTADQIYKPDQWSDDGLTHYTGNIPTPNIERAMRETWHVTLRKWNAKKNKSRFFLTGYRSGNKVPCGADSTGFKIYQQSLRDCLVKNLTTYETLRRYFEPVYIVNTRDHDMLGNGTDWIGDLGAVSDGGSSTTNWRLYAGGINAFAAPVTGTFSVNFSSVVGYGVGNVDAARSQVDDSPGDQGLLSDLVLATGSAVLVSRATPTGLTSSAISTPITTGVPDKVVVGDFNGDLLADVGLVYFGGGTTLQVLTAKGDGTFNAAQAWSGALGLTAGTFVAAGDVNGDGKDDLIVRDQANVVSTAVSSPTCSDFSVWGPCPAGAIGAPGVGVLVPATTSLVNGTVMVGDYDRDARSDLMVVAADGKSVQGMAGKANGTFADPQTLWQSTTAVSGQPVAMNVNPDGMSDLAFVGASSVTWLRTNERTTTPASMTLMQSTSDPGLSGSSKPF